MNRIVKGNYMLYICFYPDARVAFYYIYRLDAAGKISYRVADIVNRQNAITVLNVAIAQSW